MPSITFKSPSPRPSPSITIAITVYRRCARAVPHHPSPSKSHRAIHRRRGVVAPSITVKEPSIAVNPSIAFKSPLLSPSLSIAVELPLCHPSSLHHAVHHRQVAIAPSFALHRHCNHSPSASRSCHPLSSIAPKEPSRRPSPSSRHCAVHRRPSLSITIVIAVHCHCRCNCAVPCRLSTSRSRRTIYRRRGAIAPSIDVPPRHPAPSSHCPLPSIHPLLSILCRAVHCRPSPSSRHRAVHCRPPPIAVESLLHCPLLSLPSSRCCPPSITGQHPLPLRCQSPSLIRLVVASPLVTPTPPIHRFRSFRTACSTFF